jgi:tetratricopeptide (TPR) repeat protein
LTALELQVIRKFKEKEEEFERGMELVEDSIVNGDYLYAKELITALKKIKADDRLSQLEEEVNRLLAVAEQFRQEQEKEYINHLQKAQEYMDNGDYERAEEEIKKARKIKNNELLQRLEEKLKDLKGKTQGEYEKYSKWARIYLEHGELEKAKHYLELAKEIYRSHELVVLGKEIEKKIREREREEAVKKTDDEAYYKAIRSGEVWDLDEYIRKYPKGRHVREAKTKLDHMLKDFIPRIRETWVIRKGELLYRRSTRKKWISGIVWLEAVIDIQGNVTKVDVTEGERMLRNAAIEVVKQSRYEPCIIGGEPRVFRVRFKVIFGQPTEY